MKLASEDFRLDYADKGDLSYYETGADHVRLFHKGELLGEIEVWTDRGGSNREYVLINCEMIYLDEIREH